MHCLASLVALVLVAAPDAGTAPTPKPADQRERIELNLERAPWTGDLDGMIERRIIRVLVPYSKTLYWVDLGKPRGLLYELFTAFEKEVNSKVKGLPRHLQIHVFFVQTRREDFIAALLEGRGDIAAGGLTITEGRNQSVDFSTPLLTDVREVVVTGPQSPSLATLDDLAGKEVFVRKSSSFYEHLTALNAKLAQEGKAPVLIREASEALEDEDLLEMVNAGLIGITVVDEFRAKAWATILKDITIHADIALHEGGEIAWMFRKNSPQLKAHIDAFIKAKCKGKSFGAVLYKKYLTKPPVLRSAISPRELKKFDSTVALFKKYADKYDVDHLLMMAQGYQESRLNQAAISPVGAIGVMQIMPETGRELRVGDITKLEPNINGGIKYIRRVIDQYFNDSSINPQNQVFLAFAAYNCGPGRLRNLRSEAATRGLDPNVWFDNVEVVAARRIGPETVNYVSNILKYYTAYRDHEETTQLQAERSTATGSPSSRP
jgi:membrane-bound lytic murein transglycosylase MltF